MLTKKSFLLAFLFAALCATSYAQVKRTVTKTDRFDFGSGGTVTVTGAPNGSVKVIGHAKNEIEIVAEIVVEGATDSDAAKIANLTGFITDESVINARIISVGTHNKFGVKKLPKDFPKYLLTMPFSINYTITVPRFSDLDINGGKGDLAISGVEGTIRANYLESNAKVNVIAGNAVLSVGSGSLDVSFGGRGWRGRPADIQIAKGDLTIALPTSLNAEIDATVLRTGSIENAFPDLKPRDRKVAFTDKTISAKAGVGGAAMKFTVGDGKMKLGKMTQLL